MRSKNLVDSLSLISTFPSVIQPVALPERFYLNSLKSTPGTSRREEQAHRSPTPKEADLCIDFLPKTKFI